MLLTIVQVLFIIVALVGIGLLSIPAALIATGVVGVGICEWIERARRAPGPRP